jgi:hypothetical protein
VRDIRLVEKEMLRQAEDRVNGWKKEQGGMKIGMSNSGRRNYINIQLERNGEPKHLAGLTRVVFEKTETSE